MPSIIVHNRAWAIVFMQMYIRIFQTSMIISIYGYGRHVFKTVTAAFTHAKLRHASVT